MAGSPLPSASSSSPGGSDAAGDRGRFATGGDAETDAADEANAAQAEHTRRRLLRPIGGLYMLAQSLTDTERAARRLVEATYRRAAEALASGRGPSAENIERPDGEAPDHEISDDEARAWIFALLVQTAREAPAEGPRFTGEAADEKTGDAPDGSGDPADEHAAGDRHLRQRAQEQFLRRALPAAFAALTPAQRLLLTLRDVEGLDAATAASVTDRPESDAVQQHARARADLREALSEMATRPERALLDDSALPDARLAAALRRMAERDLADPPPALRPAARHALSRPARAVAPGSSRSGEPSDRPAKTPGDARTRDEHAPRRRLSRLLVAALLIALAGGLAYLATTVLDGSAPADVAALSADNAAGVNVRLRTDRADRAEQFVRDELGRRLRVPRIEGARLRGVGVAEVAPGERVPVFRFRDAASGHSVTAYAYDYALLDRAEGRLRLSGDLRRALQQEGRVSAQDVGQQRVLLWRHRDDIFAAVTARSDSLEQRLAL